MAQNQIVELALGRIFRLMSRPSQPCDVAEYERCRAIILNEFGDAPTAYKPNFAASYHAMVMRGEAN